MIADYLSKDEIADYVGALRSTLASGKLDEPAAAAAQAIGHAPDNARAAMLEALPADGAGEPSSGGEHANLPFFSRDPTVSLMQSSLEIEARKSDLVHEPPLHRLTRRIVGVVEELKEHLPEKFSSRDPEWVTRIGEATLERLSRGNHPFNVEPAEYEIADDDARVVLVGDWGSGLQHARDVAGFMAAEVRDALAAKRSVHVIHLGDVYYSGVAEEVKLRVLADGMWPVTTAQARHGVTSWSLNGNHDMYGGGWGYFGTLLADERFAKQRSPGDGKPTSYFRIRTPAWDLVGLDTSWDTEVLGKGLRGLLADPQAARVQEWAAQLDDRRMMLLSHHQFVSSYDLGDIGQVLPHKLGPLLRDGRIAAWMWGHEHRCMGFEAAEGIAGVAFMRCIGHGGVPIPATTSATIPPPGTWQIPEAGDGDGFFEEHDASWNRFGFAVMDFAGASLSMRYIDDQGHTKFSEDLT
ncbi:MAG: hypothetical protein QOG94_2696 [Solirubrobacteraceae bacterium]|nr:hypothetical protein [Solirubrobacteraceae bacterium]